jgi:hypothetical protein
LPKDELEAAILDQLTGLYRHGGLIHLPRRRTHGLRADIACWGLVKPRPSRIDTLAAEQLCLDCKDILGSPTLAKHVPDGRR